MTIVNPTEVLGASPATRSTGGLVSRFRAATSRLRESPRMLAGVVIIAFFALVAIFGPMFVHNPNAFVGPALAGPTAKFWLGTTQSGQNVFSQLIVSTRGTLEVGLAAAVIATAVALAIGIGGGFIGGISDDVLNLVTNVVLVIPVLPLIIIVSAYLKSGGLGPMIFVIAITSWAGTARVLRGMTLSLRSRDYALAARVSGERTWRIVVVEILPNLSAFIVSGFIFTVIFAILTQVGLAFIGLESPDTLTWGNMLYFAQNDEALSSGAWWWFVPPGLCIALVGTGLSLINFGLDEILNPRLRTRKIPQSR